MAALALDPASDLAVARAATPPPLAEVAARAGIPAAALVPYGREIAKVDPRLLPPRPPGRLVLVTAISPTPAGEGKTTTTIGLGDALNLRGHRAVIALREPSLGPVFGAKGGATGGGRAQVVPMEAINLHFTGDFHAVTSAHNLLAALVDNHLYWGNALDLDPGRVSWRRVIDGNDRALRQVVLGLGGPANGTPREGGFDITVASEVMAVLCLAENDADLGERLGRMVVGETRARRRVTAAELGGVGAMQVLLREALLPNLVRTLEGTPALLHGGPFANIAHGCNSVIATRAALGLGDYCVTEAGFGADLGAEKFLDIKCRQAGLAPDCAVLVASVRALKMHGGAAKDALREEDLGALARGFPNLQRHAANLRRFGLPVVVAVNHFTADTPAEHAMLARLCREEAGVEAVACCHWAQGAAGAADLADAVHALCEAGTAAFRPLYADELGLAAKVEIIAREIYGAAGVAFEPKAARALAAYEAEGFGRLPVCIAKTPASFTADASVMGAPEGHVLPVREVRLSAGAGFVVALCGEVNTMPGLPRRPAAERIGLDAGGEVVGLS